MLKRIRKGPVNKQLLDLCSSQAPDQEALQALLQSGADVRARTENYWTPLHLAVSYGHCAMAATLVQNGASVRAKGKLDWTPLHYAASRGCVTCAKTMLDTSVNRADVDAREKRTFATPLLIAAQEGHAAVVALLFERGADIMALNNQGDSCLHLAALNNRTEAAALLLCLLNHLHQGGVEGGGEGGGGGNRLGEGEGPSSPSTTIANPFGLNRKGNTALELAEGAGHTAIAQLIQAHEAGLAPDAWTPFFPSSLAPRAPGFPSAPPPPHEGGQVPSASPLPQQQGATAHHLPPPTSSYPAVGAAPATAAAVGDTAAAAARQGGQAPPTGRDGEEEGLSREDEERIRQDAEGLSGGIPSGPPVPAQAEIDGETPPGETALRPRGECPICLEAVVTTPCVLTPCGHGLFHKDCASGIVATGKCVICRQRVTSYLAVFF